MSNVQKLNTSPTFRPTLVLDGAILLAVFLGLSAAGCSGGGLAVSGHVTVNGQPLEDGDITFSPTTPGASAAQTEVIDGKYRFPGSAGLTNGTYKVAISAMRSTGRKITVDEGSTEMIESFEEYIPPKYNIRSTLTVEIDADRTDHDFKLSID